MDLKKTLSIGVVIASLGLSGTVGYYIPEQNDTCPIDYYEVTLDDKVQCLSSAEYKELKCKTSEVKLEDENDEENWYCGTLLGYNSDWEKEEKKFKDNETKKEDYVYLDLVAKNDPVKRKKLEKDLIAKYDTKTKMFDGSLMGADFNYQLMFFKTLGDIECGGGCELIGDTFDERLYNLINK